MGFLLPLGTQPRSMEFMILMKSPQHKEHLCHRRERRVVNMEKKKTAPAIGLQHRRGKSSIMKRERGYGHGVWWGRNHTELLA